LHLFKQDQVTGSIHDGKRGRRGQLLRHLFGGMEHRMGAIHVEVLHLRCLRVGEAGGE
jgi:hypothetical protein